LIEQVGARNAFCRGFQFLVTAFAEKLPSGRGDDNAAGNAKHRDRYSVELEDRRTQEQRADENEERVSGDAPSEETSGFRRRTTGQAEEQASSPAD
jgi:hypothetical protein